MDVPRSAVAGVVPRWAFVAAYAVPLCLLPSCIWRIRVALGFGLPDGWYPLALSLAELGLGSLTLGLVHSWGETVPRWVPLAGGRHVLARVAVIPAVTGAVAVTLLGGYGVLNDIFHFVTPEQARAVSPVDSRVDPRVGPPGGWVVAAYLPSLAWGPLLAAVTFAYHRRRRGPVRPSSGLAVVADRRD